MTDDEQLYLVTDFGPAAHGAYVVAAAWVTATSPADAAEFGRLALKQDNGDDEQDYCQTVAVTSVDGVAWFEFEARAVPAVLQCCGGADSSSGHSGYCEHHQEER